MRVTLRGPPAEAWGEGLPWEPQQGRTTCSGPPCTVGPQHPLSVPRSLADSGRRKGRTDSDCAHFTTKALLVAAIHLVFEVPR